MVAVFELVHPEEAAFAGTPANIARIVFRDNEHQDRLPEFR
jgi:hypothetical protein